MQLQLTLCQPATFDDRRRIGLILYSLAAADPENVLSDDPSNNHKEHPGEFHKMFFPMVHHVQYGHGYTLRAITLLQRLLSVKIKHKTIQNWVSILVLVNTF